MGNQKSSAERRQARVNNQIDRLNRKDYDIERAKVKLLLLGTGESGKSTLLKQMKLLYGTKTNFSTMDLALNIKAIRSCVVSNMQELVKQSLNKYYPLADPSLSKSAARFLAIQHSLDDMKYNEADIVAMKQLWNDKGIQQTWEEKRNLIQVQDSVPYFMSRVDDIFELSPAARGLTEAKHDQNSAQNSANSSVSSSISNPMNSSKNWQKNGSSRATSSVNKNGNSNGNGGGNGGYMPTDEDWLRVRVRTSGVVEEVFQLDGVEFNILDVGGQRNERKKWLFCFSNVRAVIYVVALNEYDQFLFEDAGVNRMVEALDLFEKTVNDENLASCGWILFLNKSDLYKDKLSRSPIKYVPKDDDDEKGTKTVARFEDYTGKDVTGLDPMSAEFEQGYQDGIDYFTAKFTGRIHTPSSKDIYTHVTCAMDQHNVFVVFNACRGMILKEMMTSQGFIPKSDF